LNKYIKCRIWRSAVRYDPYTVRRQMVNIKEVVSSSKTSINSF